MPGYSALDRLLHRLALQVLPIAELSFHLDQRLVRRDPHEITGERHVFISGLARAGTTALMRRFYATGAYRSLTYRDMPFVLAPNLWSRLAGSSRRQLAPAERAHGDGIFVDPDSPESLDEVFWRVFSGAAYIEKTHLKPHTPDAETVRSYVSYINAVLESGRPHRGRFLAKNNNGILRLESLRLAFPNALILVPFRDPAEHAASLLRQHRRFSHVQAEDRFARSYMRWLAHHEFGRDHRPFRFDGGAEFTPSPHSPDTDPYWLELWVNTYSWLERAAPQDAVFVCYEALCDGSDVWNRLAAAAGIPPGGPGAAPFRSGNSGEEALGDTALAGRARALYARLRERADPGR